MSVQIYDVTLVGADDQGKFVVTFRVSADGPVEAEIMGRASAAAHDFAVFALGQVGAVEGVPEAGKDARRILGRGQRFYQAA